MYALARLEFSISVYQSHTRSITTIDPKDPVPSRYPSYPAHRVQFLTRIRHGCFKTPCIETNLYPEFSRANKQAKMSGQTMDAENHQLLLTSSPAQNSFLETTENYTLQIQRKCQVLFVYHVPETHVPESHVPESHVPESHVPVLRPRPTFSHSRRLCPNFTMVCSTFDFPAFQLSVILHGITFYKSTFTFILSYTSSCQDLKCYQLEVDFAQSSLWFASHFTFLYFKFVLYSFKSIF